jgi:NAD kinase
MGMQLEDKIVIVTRQTRMKGLLKRYATAGQAEFVMRKARLAEQERHVNPKEAAVMAEVAGASFEALEEEEENYKSAVDFLKRELDLGPRVQVIDREYLPNFLFGPKDIIVTVGQDGLVANTAKYAGWRPIVGVNPDPRKIDGVLLPFKVEEARMAVRGVLTARARYREVNLAEATLPDGQKLLAFNDLFVGNRTHVSARYRLELQGRSEPQSSSGVLISTGAGSTGWLSSVFNMAAGLGEVFSPGSKKPAAERMQWEDPRLIFVVREPFISKQSRAGLVAGMLEQNDELVIESMMPEGGVIFSDGVESDFLQFNAGVIARVHSAQQKARLVIA